MWSIWLACLRIPFIPDAHQGPLELELQIVVNHYVIAGNPGPLQAQVYLTAEPILTLAPYWEGFAVVF